MLRDRAYLWLAGLLFMASLPARFAFLHDSVWMDEAWVANSVLEPSMRDMFFTRTWTQSSPPLFLVLQRWMAGMLGSSEAALRVLPLAGGLAGLAISALVLRRWLPPMAALLGFALLCTNYYLIKYSQHVKQYGTDFLVAAVLMGMVGRYVESRSRRDWGALLAAGVVGMSLSYTAVFWLATLVAASGLPRDKERAWPASWREVAWRRLVAAGCVLGGALALVYVVFIEPNRTAAMARSFATSYLDLRDPAVALQRLAGSLGTLLAALPGLVSAAVGIAATALAGYALLRAAGGIRRGDQGGVMVVIAGGLPLACTIAAGALHLYPVLDYARMLLFALPSLALLLGAGGGALLMPLLGARWEQNGVRAAFAGVCMAVVVASQAILFRYPRPGEENRPAVALLQSRMQPGDLLFVHGGMYEQFKYYRELLGFRPAGVYIGSKQWPCCATGDREQATNPSAPDFESDLLEAGRRAHGHALWLLMPAGARGHWSGGFRRRIEAAPAILAGGGCRREERMLFGQTLVEGYRCQ